MVSVVFGKKSSSSNCCIVYNDTGCFHDKLISSRSQRCVLMLFPLSLSYLGFTELCESLNLCLFKFGTFSTIIFSFLGIHQLTSFYIVPKSRGLVCFYFQTRFCSSTECFVSVILSSIFFCFLAQEHLPTLDELWL